MARRNATAGFVYFLIVFAAGFMFGTVRVLVVEPKLGPVWSVALEVPLMLLVSWWVARLLVDRYALEAAGDALAIGVIGAVLLVVAETLLGMAFGQGLLDQLRGYATARGLLTAIGQLGFAAMPALVLAGRRQQT